MYQNICAVHLDYVVYWRDWYRVPLHVYRVLIYYSSIVILFKIISLNSQLSTLICPHSQVPTIPTHQVHFTKRVACNMSNSDLLVNPIPQTPAPAPAPPSRSPNSNSNPNPKRSSGVARPNPTTSESRVGHQLQIRRATSPPAATGQEHPANSQITSEQRQAERQDPIGEVTRRTAEICR